MKRWVHWSIFGILAVATVIAPLAACSGPDITPTPTKTPRAPSTPTAAPPTPTPQPTIDVQKPTPEPTSAPSGPTPLPTIMGDVWPLTGLPVEDPALLERPPFAVKVSNNPEVRPQSGLQFADIVFEHLAEGGFTRYTAIFHSTGAERVGALRSARLIDLEIPAMFKCAFAYSGAVADVERMIRESDFADRAFSQSRAGAAMYRIPIPGRATEHTLFTDTDSLWALAKDRRLYGVRDLRGMRFDPNPPAGGRATRSVFIPYSSYYSNVTWTWDAARGAYLHSVLGQPHKDTLTDQQIGANNVVLVYVNHVQTLIVEDRLGARSVQIQIWGEGKATVLRDGKAWDVTWKRPNREDPITLVGSDGQLFPLKPGNTWYNMVPLDMKVTME